MEQVENGVLLKTLAFQNAAIGSALEVDRLGFDVVDTLDAIEAVIEKIRDGFLDYNGGEVGTSMLCISALAVIGVAVNPELLDGVESL